MTSIPHSTDNALVVESIAVDYGARPVVTDASFTARAGTVTTIIGPNGSGKSTLLRCVAALSGPRHGTVSLADLDVHRIPHKLLARKLAMLPQTAVAPEGLTVADLVAGGRQPPQRWYRQWSHDGEEIVLDSMRQLNVDQLGERPLDELSGGQRQRAWIAMCLAQQTPVILLDEPTTHLDIAHAVEILETVGELARNGRTVVMVLHDLGLAARYSDQIVVLADGQITGRGAPGEILTPALIHEAFGLDAHVFPDPVDGGITIVPARPRRATPVN